MKALKYAPVAAALILGWVYFATPLAFLPLPMPTAAHSPINVFWLALIKSSQTALTVGTAFMTKAGGMFLLSLTTLLFWLTARSKAKGREWVGVAAALAFVLDPWLRWAAAAGRTEMLLAPAWMIVLANWEHLSSESESERTQGEWKISLALGLSLLASVRVPALLWAPTLLVFAPTREAKGLRMFWRAKRGLLFKFVFLGFVGLGIGAFLSGNPLGFATLSTDALPGAGNAFELFFPNEPSAAGAPLGGSVIKALFWAAILFGTYRTTYALLTRVLGSTLFLGRHGIGMLTFWVILITHLSGPRIATAVALHAMLWPWLVSIAYEETDDTGVRWMARVTPPILALLAGLGMFYSGAQLWAFPRGYGFNEYGQWTQCLERAIRHVGAPGKTIGVWQMGGTDAIAELMGHRAEIVRAARPEDFGALRELDVIILGTSGGKNDVPEHYEGPERAQDQKKLLDLLQPPLNFWIAEKLPLTPENPWRRQICQSGPFWANISVRLKRTQQ